LTPPSDQTEPNQCGTDKRQRCRLRHIGRVIASRGSTDLPGLRAARGATIREICREVGGTRTASTECRVQNEVIGAQPARPGDVELQVAKIGIGRSVTRGAVDRDAKGPVRRVVTVAGAEAEQPKGINAARGLDERGTDAALGAGQSEREWRMRPAAVDKPISRQGQRRVDQIDEHVHGRGIDLCEGYDSDVGWL